MISSVQGNASLAEAVHLKHLIHKSADGALIINYGGDVVFANPAAEQLFGRSGDKLIGKPFGFPVVNSDRTELDILHSDGTMSVSEMRVSVAPWDGQMSFIVTLRDITERKQREEQRGRLAAQVFENTTEGILITNLDVEIVDVNPAFSLITGYQSEEVIGQNPNILSSAWQDAEFYETLWNNIHSKGLWQGEIWNKRKNGEIYAEWLTICVVKNEQGQVVNYVGQLSDITSRKKMEEGLQHLAYYDGLTHLPNRSMLLDKLRQAIAQSQRYGTLLALMFIDLDRFKIVNDCLGHHMGDLLLSMVAQRLKECLREGDFIARLGGDEFTVLLDRFTAKNEIAATAQKIIDTLGVSFNMNGQEVFIGCSMGICVFPTDADTLDTLLISADSAMYRAKELGGNTYQFYSGDAVSPAKERINLENDLRHALEQDELVVYYQPVVDLCSGAILGAEALLRWNHPKLGLLAPDRFISLAEETGLIVPIGEWVMRVVSTQSLEWSKVFGHCPPIAVNLSVRQLLNRNAMESLVEIIGHAAQSSICLHLEVTESILLDQGKSTLTLLETLKTKGVQLLLDDFGTGYSSLTYLQHFPLDGLKIDCSFISNLETSPNDAAIVKAIIAMTNSLGLRVVAEGVETEYQRKFLVEQQCTEAQGYYFSPPVCAMEMIELLRQGVIVRPGS